MYTTAMRPSPRSLPFLIVVIITLGLGYSIGAWTHTKAGTRSTLSVPELIRRLVPQDTTDTTTLQAVWDSIHQKYVNQNIDDVQLTRGAISGVVLALGDPYSAYFAPDETEQFKQEIEGIFNGVGMEIGYKNNLLTIIAPLPNSPAAKAGLQPGDTIAAINGQSASALKLDEAISMIRGPKGTTVELKIQRGKEPEVRTFTIARDTITVDSVTSKEITDGQKKYGYIRISSFNQDTSRLFQSQARSLLQQGVKGFIIDLRNNPGGYLDQAVKISSAFIESGPIVSEVGRDGTKRDVNAEGAPLLSDQPVIVLVNEGSASASEIVAGALQDTKKATIIGKKTFGKGSVQEIVPLNDGSSLKLTVAKWLTPKGTSISEHGVTPDVDIDLSSDDFNHDRDPQLDKAKELLRSKT